MELGVDRWSSGSHDYLFTGAIETPPNFPQQTAIVAQPAFGKTSSSWSSSGTGISPRTHGSSQDETNTTRPNPSSPMYTINPSSLLQTPLDRLPPPPDISTERVSLSRRRRLPSRPAVCNRRFDPSLEDASFYMVMQQARAHPKFREPAELKKVFCSRNERGCQKHPAPCFTIHIGSRRTQCRTETVALRAIHVALGLCWTCHTW
jgi:hypothetical protein